MTTPASTSSDTSTSTEATTTGNVTVTGGAGDGATNVTILPPSDEIPTMVGLGSPPVPSLSPEAKAATMMHSKIEEAKTLLRKGLGTSFVFDETRDALFRQAFDLLSNIATE